MRFRAYWVRCTASVRGAGGYTRAIRLAATIINKVPFAHGGSKVRSSRHKLKVLVLAGTMLLVSSACDKTGLPPGYRDVTVPSAMLSSLDARDRGRVLYLQHCALCHGERADGQGRRSLSVRPADFTDLTWRESMTPRWVFYVIREGIRGTPMPAWKTLDAEQTWNLVAYVLSVAEVRPDAGSP